MLPRICVLLFLCAFPTLVRSQTACPNGVAAGSAGCGPSSLTSGFPIVEPIGPTWELTWGAVVIDPDSGDIVAATGKKNRHTAKREAMKGCQARGAKNCQVALAFKGGCIAVAWPRINPAGILAASSATVAEASQVALQACATSTDDVCRIVYTECTLPELVD